MNEPYTDDQQELLDTELEWVRAHHEMDIKTIHAILDDNYTQLKGDGTIIGKQDLLADYSTGQRYWEIAESEPLKVQIIDNIGLLFGKWRGKGVNNGQLFDYSTCFLAVYRKRGGVWKLLADASLV